MHRGIVLSPKFIRRPVGDVLFESAVDDLELRKYLLYWDKINVPRSTFVDFDCTQFRELEAVGVLERTSYGQDFQSYLMNMSNSSNCTLRHIRCGNGVGIGKINDCYNVSLDPYMGEQILDAHNDVFSLLESKEPGCWSKAQMSPDLISFDNLNERGLEINLYNLLPVPSVNTSLIDILQFKDKRHDELVAFRCYVDDLYKVITNSDDPARAYNAEMNRLNLALIDLNRTMKESRFNVMVDSFRSVVNGIDGIVGTGIAVGATAAITTTLGVTPLVAGLSAAGLVLAPKLIPKARNTIPQHMTYIKEIRSKLN